MRLDKFQFVLTNKETRNEVALLDVEYAGNSVGNCRMEENRKSNFVNILDDIINNANSSESIKAQIVKVIEIAKQYSFYRKHWNDFSLQELPQRNKERTDEHDLFILELNKLAEDIAKFTGRETTWEKILRNDRNKLGDFAEYIAEYADNIKEIITRSNASRTGGDRDAKY